VEPDWDQRYRDGFYDGAVEAHGLVQRLWHLFPPGPVLDIASGNGRDIIYVARKGRPGVGLERSAEALKIARKSATGTGLLLVRGEAGTLPFKKGLAAGVLVFYFLERGMIEEVGPLLKKGGILIYETFLERQNAVDGRRNPAHLLGDGELYRFFGDLETLFYEETVSSREGKRLALAKFVGRKQ
jgi:tellurite methyltransferase